MSAAPTTPEALQAAKELIDIVLQQCGGFLSGPGFVAAQKARALKAALAAPAEGQQPAEQAVAHTVDDDFEHFLSYSGFRNEPADVLAKLRMAYEHAWEPAEPGQESWVGGSERHNAIIAKHFGNDQAGACKAQDVLREVLATPPAPTQEGQQAVGPADFDGDVIIGHSVERGGWCVYEQTAPGEYLAFKGPFATREEAETAMHERTTTPAPTAPGKAEAVPSPLGWSMHCPWCQQGFVAMPSPGKVPAPPDLAAELQECREALDASRKRFGEPGSRDVDVVAWNACVDRAIAAIDALRRKGGAA